jgi:hypothetical protein
MKSIREWINETVEEKTVLFEPPELDEAIIGITEDLKHVVYSYSKLVDAYAKMDGMGHEEAMEFVEYNTIRTLPYIDEETRPIVVVEPPEE